MIKTNIKMRVTPEQLIEIGKIKPICKSFTNAKFIFIYKDGRTTWSNKEYEFNRKESMQEIDPELFIRTNGSCVEKLTSEYIEKVINEGYKIDNSINNGGKTDYYQLENAPFKINDFDDFAEWRGLNGSQFNMGKVMWTFNTGRHSGTDYERDLNKIIHYANRELLRLKRGEK